MKKLMLLSTAMAIAGIAAAQTYSAECFLNLTVQEAGPRPGFNGTNFFNIQGDGSAAQFRSWGVAVFRTEDFGFPSGFAPTSVDGIKLKLQSRNAAFSRAGNVDVWVTLDNSTVVDQSQVTIFYDQFDLPSGLGNQMLPKHKGATFNFPYTGNSDPANNGVTFTIDLASLSDTAKAHIVSELNKANGQIRVLLSAAEANTTATFTGNTSTVDANGQPPFGPTLEFTFSKSLSGKVVFDQWPNNAPTPVVLEFRDPNNLESVVFSTQLTLSEDGSFTTSALPPTAGNYDLAIKYAHFLRDSIGTVDTGNSASGLEFTLLNGDVNGDNEVNLDDYFDLADSYRLGAGDAGFNVNADLDGTGFVDLDDYFILAENFRKVGDE